MGGLVFARIEPIVDSLLPQEQAGFRRGRSATDQITLLTQGIEYSFSAKTKAGAVIMDLTTVYDTIWHRSFACKLLRLLLDRHIVSVIMELVCYYSFVFTTCICAQSRLQRLKHDIP